MRSKLVASGVAVLAAIGLGGSVYAGSGSATVTRPTSTAAVATASNIEHFRIVGINQKEGVVAHGVFTGAGRAEQHGQTDTLHLGGGAIEVKHPDSQSHFRFHLNPTTCYVTIFGRGKYQIMSGTGRFEGVTGHGTYRFHGQGVLNRTDTGDCQKRGEPRYQVSTIRAHGPARLP